MMAAVDEAILESVVLLDHFADLPDPRQLSKVIYPLDEILLLSLLAVLAGASAVLHARGPLFQPCTRSIMRGDANPHATLGRCATTPSVRARTSGEARQVATAS